MSKLATFNVKWVESAGLAIVERVHLRRRWIFWTKREYEAVAHFPTTAEATKWIIDKRFLDVPAKSAGGTA